MFDAFDDLIDSLKNCSKGAANAIQDNYGLMADEDDMTSRFLARFATSIEQTDAYVTPALQSVTIPWRGEKSAESRFGADYAIAYSLRTSSFSYGAGILVQAKRRDRRDFPPINGLRKDSKNMLDYSPASYISVYSDSTFRFYPASGICGLKQNRLVHENNDYTLNQAVPSELTHNFYELLFQGFIGDKWVYENLDFLSNPGDYAETGRQALTDGGEVENQDGGIDTLLIVASDTSQGISPYDNLPYDEQFISEEVELSETEGKQGSSGQSRFDEFM